MTTKMTVSTPPGVRASISSLIGESAGDAWKAFLQNVAREYRPLTDLQAHKMCLEIHDEATKPERRKTLRAQLAANCAPLAAQAARQYVTDFGGDWRASAMAALEIVQAALPDLHETTTRKGVTKVVKSGYDASRAILNLHGWVVTAFPVEMAKKAQADRAVMHGGAAELIAKVKSIWAASLDRLGNTYLLDVPALPGRVVSGTQLGPVNEGVAFDTASIIEFGKDNDFLFDGNFTLRAITRDSVSVGVYGLRAVRATLKAEIAEIQARTLTEQADKVQANLSKGWDLQRAVNSICSRQWEKHRAILNALNEDPAVLTVWLSGQARPLSLDAKTEAEDGDAGLSFGDRIVAPETALPRYAASFARADLLTAREALRKVGNSALRVARADLRDLTRTTAQVEVERQARKEWRELCQELHIGEKYAASHARKLLNRVKARFADNIADEQVEAMKIVSDAWNEGLEKDERIPWVKVAFAWRRYGRRIGDATPHLTATLEALHVSTAQANALVALTGGTRAPRARKATGARTPLADRQAYAAVRMDANALAAFHRECTRQGLTPAEGTAVARRALHLTDLRFAETLGDNATRLLKAVTPAVAEWAAHRGLRASRNLPALCRAFHAYGIAATDATVNEAEVEASIAADFAAAQGMERPEHVFNHTRRAIQRQAEREARSFDERGQRITQALNGLRVSAHRTLGDNWHADLQDVIAARAALTALSAAHQNFLTAVAALEVNTDGGNVLLIAEALLQAEEAAADCERIISGDPIAIAAGTTRHVKAA